MGIHRSCTELRPRKGASANVLFCEALWRGSFELSLVRRLFYRETTDETTIQCNETRFFTVLTLLMTLFTGGCTAAVSSPSSSEQFIANSLFVFLSSLGVFSIILWVLFIIVGNLWIIMPFFVWRIATHTKRSAVRVQFIYKTLHRLEVISAVWRRGLSMWNRRIHKYRANLLEHESDSNTEATPLPADLEAA